MNNLETNKHPPVKKNKFAFLVHPRDISDMARPLPWIKYLPHKLTSEIIQRLNGRLGFIVWSKFDVYNKAEGWIIFVSLTGEQIMSLPKKYVQKRILDAILYAQNNLGVDVIGLGAYTAPITDAGQWIVKQDKIKVNVTHGDSFSVVIALEGIEKILAKQGISIQESKIGIIGAYGLIGKALALSLAGKCDSLYLVGRNKIKLDSLRQTINSGTTKIFSSQILDDISKCDVVVTATSFPKSLLLPNHLKQNAIVYDLAQPINLYPRVLISRPDVIRIDGCYVKIPNINLGIEMGPPPGTTFACLAETMMQALEGEKKNHVGDITLAHIEKTTQWAKKYDFFHADFTNFGDPLKI